MHAPATDPTVPITFKPRVQRFLQGALLKKLYAQGRLPAHHMSLATIETSKVFETFPDFSYAMTDSDLWKPLTSTYGKCDGMVPGKYRKARVFCFETESLYLWCDSETGDRGTRWLFIEKIKLDAKTLKSTKSYSSSILDTQPHLGAELVSFTLNLLLDMAQAGATSRADLIKLGAGSWTPFLAMQAQDEALELSLDVRPTTQSSAKIRM